MEVINDDDFLLRRVPSNIIDPLHIKEDGTPTSIAFSLRKQDTNGLSVDIEKLTTSHKAVIDRNKFRLFKFKSEVPRSLGLNCIHDPMPDNYAHALIQGEFTKAICRKLASEAGKNPVVIPDSNS